MTPRPSCITANPTRRLNKHPRHTEINPVPPHGTAQHSSALRLPGKEKKQQMLLLSKPGTELKEATGSQGNFLRDPSCTCGTFPSRKPSLALSCFVWTTQNKVGIIQITKNKSPKWGISGKISNLVIVEVIATVWKIRGQGTFVLQKQLKVLVDQLYFVPVFQRTLQNSGASQ